MKSPKIVFMGTPDFAVTVLNRLIEQNYNIVGVITAPDRPAGRGRKLQESAVKKYSRENNLPILQPTNLKSEDFITTLKELEADLQIVVAFRMLPKIVWNMPRLGTFNLHASLLPDYRGAAPIHWAIINGENKTGVSTFFLNEEIDTGEIILRKEVNIRDDETVGELHDKLMYLGADLVCQTIDLIKKDKITTVKQHEKNFKLAPKLNSENTKIDWNQSIELIYNHIRGLNPFPAAWTEIKSGEDTFTVKIYGVHKVHETHNYEPGTILTKSKQIKIYGIDGFINIEELKISGKRKMDAKSLLNGFEFAPDATAL